MVGGGGYPLLWPGGTLVLVWGTPGQDRVTVATKRDMGPGKGPETMGYPPYPPPPPPPGGQTYTYENSTFTILSMRVVKNEPDRNSRSNFRLFYISFQNWSCKTVLPGQREGQFPRSCYVGYAGKNITECSTEFIFRMTRKIGHLIILLYFSITSRRLAVLFHSSQNLNAN